MELLDLVARTRRQVGVSVCLEEGGKEGGFGDGELCRRHAEQPRAVRTGVRNVIVAPFKVSWAHSQREK